MNYYFIALFLFSSTTTDTPTPASIPMISATTSVTPTPASIPMISATTTVTPTPPSPPPLCVQFEPGKCISESAGAVLCRILTIRELNCSSYSSSSASGSARAVILDVCIGDIPMWYSNPILWAKASVNMHRRYHDHYSQSVVVSVGEVAPPPSSAPSSSSSSTPQQQSMAIVARTDDIKYSSFMFLPSTHDHLQSPDSSHSKQCSHRPPLSYRTQSSVYDACWQPLSHGSDELWGRSCMEFDKIGVFGVTLPSRIAEGDYLLFTGCGAYESTMQYDFGDGRARDMHVE